MVRFIYALVVGIVFAASASAGQLADSVLVVDDRPFFPLGSWNGRHTTPDDIALLGMNTSFRSGPGTAQGVAEFLPFMRRCADLSIQVVAYVSYGGAGIEPWPPENVRAISRLGSEPNLLAWYVGDDIVARHLPGIRQTVTILREEASGIPTVADYIDHTNPSPEAKRTFTEYVDIRCQYTYPFPERSVREYMEFLDEQREFVGDPLWTWVQCFMGVGTGNWLNMGVQDGPAPIPEPEQVRLLAFAAINRGVRGLLFFSHHDLQVLPEMAAEVSLMCREVRLVSDHLAGGSITMDLTASDTVVNAASFEYGGSTVVSAFVAREHHHRWMDESIVRNVVIDVPWTGDELPEGGAACRAGRGRVHSGPGGQTANRAPDDPEAGDRRIRSGHN